MIRRSVHAVIWGMKKAASSAVRTVSYLQSRYVPETPANGVDHPNTSDQVTSSAGNSFLKRTIGLCKTVANVTGRWGMKYGRRFANYVIGVLQYYWRSGNSIKEYLIDFDPNFRPPSVTRKEIVLDADRKQVGGVWDGKSWEVDLPPCCVVCGKQSRVERNSEVRIVEHFRRPVWIVAACWGIGFVWAIWNFRFSYLLLGVAVGLALGYRFREFLTVRIRFQRCRDHIQQTEFPGLRAVGRRLVVTTGHKSVRQQFVDLAEGHDLGGVSHDMGLVAAAGGSSPVEQVPIALVDDVEGEASIQHQLPGLESSTREDSGSSPASDVYISVPEAPSRSTPVSQYYRKTLNSPIDKDRSMVPDSEERPAVPSSDEPRVPLFDESMAPFQQRRDDSYRPSSESIDSYGIRDRQNVSGADIDQSALQRSDYQRALLWQEGLAEQTPPGLKRKPSLTNVLQGCFDAEHVLAEAFVSMLVFFGWGLIAGMIYGAYLYRDLVLGGNDQMLAVYAVLNVSLSVFFALALGWGTLYMLTVGLVCVVIAFQEQVLPVMARDWIQSHLTVSTLKVELIVLSTVPLLAMMGFSFLRSLSAQCGNLMWISRRAAWEENAIQGINRPLGDLNRALTIVIWGFMPALLAAAGIAYGYYQLDWSLDEIQSNEWFLPAIAAMVGFALLYIPVGFSVAGVKPSTNPLRVLFWMLRTPIDYLACYAVALPYVLLGAVIVGGVYFALSRQNIHIGRSGNPELTWWATITVALGVIQFPLIALSHMLGLVALKNESRLHWKGTPQNG
ncbi:MAG: hypothetical protein O2955_04545 [Planctomycetota bacterium]|nr:hypothetical protein [Planctomycetota bacterium]MDA1211759.1 hypothetical protein [Planctomycetota bacterium]